MKFHFSILVACCLLAACATSSTDEATQPSGPVSLTGYSPEQMVVAIRADAGSKDRELLIAPIRDTRVEDLRTQAQQLEKQKKYNEASTALDEALTINPEDPALLQERAEAAILQKDYKKAEFLARDAFAKGSNVGPLCRRHWSTIRYMRMVAADKTGADSAKLQIEGCNVSGPNRF